MNYVQILFLYLQRLLFKMERKKIYDVYDSGLDHGFRS